MDDDLYDAMDDQLSAARGIVVALAISAGLGLVVVLAFVLP